MKIYLDVCCLCRLFDNHSDTRVRLEAEAVLEILKRCSLDWELVPVRLSCMNSDLSAIPAGKRMRCD